MSSKQPQQTAEYLRRRLRGELKQARQTSGLTQKQVAEDLDWHPSKIIRIETGDVSVTPTDVRAMLGRYGVSDQDKVDEVVNLAREAKNQPQPWSQYRDVYSQASLTLFGYEASAATIYKYEPTFVPGLFQTEKYAEATLTDVWGKDPATVERMVTARLERQELLESDPHPEIAFILDEAAVSRAVGGPEVMRRQLAHLLELSKRPKISIQILPFAAGGHFGMRGAFTILQFPGSNDDDLLYLENAGGETTTRDDPHLVSEYLQAYWNLEARASRPSDLGNALEPVDRRLRAMSANGRAVDEALATAATLGNTHEDPV